MVQTLTTFTVIRTLSLVVIHFCVMQVNASKVITKMEELFLQLKKNIIYVFQL